MIEQLIVVILAAMWAELALFGWGNLHDVMGFTIFVLVAYAVITISLKLVGQVLDAQIKAHSADDKASW